MMRKQKSRQERGLSKYDAPLVIQFKKGANAFMRNERSPYNYNSMQYREWLRGWNYSYGLNLKKVKSNEARRRG